jgi:hypothetical protein
MKFFLKYLVYFLFLMIVISELNAQRPNTKNIAIPYIQWPIQPLEENIELYRSTIVNKSTIFYNPISKLKLEGYKETVYMNDADLEIKFVINAISFSSYINKELYDKKINDSTYVKAEGGRYMVESRINYSEYVTDIKNNIELISNEGIIRRNSLSSGFIKNYIELVNLYKNRRDRDAIALSGNIINASINSFHYNLNNNFGFPLYTYYMPFARGKGRKFNYSDLKKAFDDFKSVSQMTYRTYKNSDRFKEGYFNDNMKNKILQKLNNCIEIWENAIKEYIPNKRKTRIGDKIIDHLYLNLSAAQFMKTSINNNFDLVYKNLSKVKMNKGEIKKANNFEDKMIDLQDRININLKNHE